jgi:hypothetical protein
VSFAPKQIKSKRVVARGPSAAEAIESETRIPFVFQEVVMCRVNGAWKKASVAGTTPLRVRVLGESEVFAVDLHDVKKCDTRPMVTIADSLPIRVLAHSKSAVQKRLAKGTTVQVVAVEGDFVRINAPMIGYVQFRNDNTMFLLEPSYRKPAHVAPTLILTNLPAGATEHHVYNCLFSLTISLEISCGDDLVKGYGPNPIATHYA